MQGTSNSKGLPVLSIYEIRNVWSLLRMYEVIDRLVAVTGGDTRIYDSVLRIVTLDAWAGTSVPIKAFPMAPRREVNPLWMTVSVNCFYPS